MFQGLHPHAFTRAAACEGVHGHRVRRSDVQLLDIQRAAAAATETLVLRGFRPLMEGDFELTVSCPTRGYLFLLQYLVCVVLTLLRAPHVFSCQDKARLL